MGEKVLAKVHRRARKGADSQCRPFQKQVAVRQQCESAHTETQYALETPGVLLLTTDMDLLKGLGVLLVLLLGSAHCWDDLEPVLKAVGDSMEMGFCFGVDYIVGYKLTGEERELMGNSSSESPKGFDGRVKVTYHIASLLGLEISNLTSADTGVYLRECWQDHELINQQKHYLYVCGEKAASQDIVVSPEGGADFTCNTPSTGLPESSIRWYREVYPKYKTTLFLDTQLSQTPIQPELQGEIQVRGGGVGLHIPTSVMKKSRNFHCLVLREGQCLAYQDIEFPESEEPDVKTIFRSAGDRVLLPCPMKHPDQKTRFWETPLGQVESNTTTEDHHLSVLKGKVSGEYSLLIPHLSEDHAGDYKCFAPLLVADYAVTVCPKHDSTELKFSDGDEVDLKCLPEEGHFSIQWYRQHGPDEDTLLVDSGDPSIPFPEDLRGRATFSEETFTLTISRLTPEDNRTYWCVVLEEITFLEEYNPAIDDEEDSEGEGDTDSKAVGENEDYNAWEDEDKCLSRQVSHLIYKAPKDPRSGPKSTSKSESDPEPESTTNPAVFGIVGGVIGLVILGAVIATVFKIRAKKRHDQARKDPVQYIGSEGEVAGLAPQNNRP